MDIAEKILGKGTDANLGPTPETCKQASDEIKRLREVILRWVEHNKHGHPMWKREEHNKALFDIEEL